MSTYSYAGTVRRGLQNRVAAVGGRSRQGAGRDRGEGATASAATGRVGRMIFGVPARFMAPRLIIYVTTFALVAFGILMIYSSSSVTAMSDPGADYNPAYYAQRQLIFAVVGLVVAVVVARVDYHVWARTLMRPIWLGTIALLVLVFTAAIGTGAYGATRWITLGPFTLQPSEFAKATVILTMANVTARYLERHEIGANGYLRRLAIEVGVPLGAILLQPDKGTTIICAVTLLVMAYLGGIKKRWLLIATGAAVVLAAFLILRDDYSRARLQVAWDPWVDEWGDGYQIIQGLYAFSSGGLFGLGIGMSRQKYSYLPMAHNDFIYAIVGEELGLVGALGVLVVFGLFVWAAFQVARRAPDLVGRLIAAGCSSLIIIQLAVNVGGVLGIIPLTGKPVPFISYGGSSIMSCLILVGLIVSVSQRSSLPVTEFDERRDAYALSSATDVPVQPSPMLSLVGEPTPRSRRSATAASGRTAAPTGLRPLQLTVIGGGRAALETGAEGARTPAALRAARAFENSHGKGRISVDARGRRRIDLGPDAATRLRGR